MSEDYIKKNVRIQPNQKKDHLYLVSNKSEELNFNSEETNFIDTIDSDHEISKFNLRFVKNLKI